MREVIAADLAALEEQQRVKAARQARLLVIVRRIAAAYLTIALLTIGSVLPTTAAWHTWDALYNGLVAVPYVVGYVIWCVWKVLIFCADKDL